MSSNAKLTPQQTVINFISDYEAWNQFATHNLSEDTGFQAKEEYIKLLNEYCTQSSGRIGYNTYGQYSLCVSGGERVISTKKNNQDIIIVTGMPSRFGETDGDLDYFEYHLVLGKNKYLIKEVYQLSKSGKKIKTL
ncbi:hypothetical protein [Enterobacter hormaechei]|uniref:hypothetical protein n=1 Tax=Enterobacter hormaechei TaxID=158836 RepID=UPI001868B13E|nr:hypothetical protein [Enterobacter hormaechei]MDK3077366.1 hypothetical protein [Enterobacter hormaechei]